MNEREAYEAPAVTDFGTIEEMTQGELKVSITDLPTGVGSPLASPTPPSSGSI